MYELLLLIGGLGFLAMAAMGMIHTGGGGHGHGQGADGHGMAGHSHAGIGHGHGHVDAPALDHGHGANSGHIVRGGHPVKGAGGGGKSITNSLLVLVSPMDLFALALGAGATGLLLQKILAPNMLVWAAVAGALALNFLVLKPFFAMAMRFVTKPSEGLEGTVALKALATTRFDHDGRGIVQLTLDGQIVQLLASLDPAERELGESVSKGDEVTVLEVDAKRNACTVSKLSSNRNP